jgi:hypothetical protein
VKRPRISLDSRIVSELKFRGHSLRAVDHTTIQSTVDQLTRGDSWGSLESGTLVLWTLGVRRYAWSGRSSSLGFHFAPYRRGEVTWWPDDAFDRRWMACFDEERPMGEEEGNWKGAQEWWRTERLGCLL